MEAGYGAIVIQIIGFGLAGCVLHHIVLFFRQPERLDEIYHPHRKHSMDHNPKFPFGSKLYLTTVFIGVMAMITTFISVLLDWSRITVSGGDALNPMGLLFGVLGAAGILSNIADQARKAVQFQAHIDRLKHEGDERRSVQATSQAERAELQRLRASASADYQKIADLERTIADLQPKRPVTIRFEG